MSGIPLIGNLLDPASMTSSSDSTSSTDPNSDPSKTDDTSDGDPPEDQDWLERLSAMEMGPK